MTTVVSQGQAAAVVERQTSIVVTRQGGETVVVRQWAPRQLVVTRGIAGPPGRPGDPSGALLIGNRLGELAADPAAQQQAQQNIGLGSIDPLAYYILAKS